MRALIRYVTIKSAREQFAKNIVLMPLLIIGAPLLGLTARALLLGNGEFPFFLSRSSSTETLLLVLAAAINCSAVAAGVAAFWIFRHEIADQSIASLVLATPPRLICLTAAGYGAAIGIASFVVILPLVVLIVGAFPGGVGATLLALILMTMLNASLAATLAAISADLGMLLALLPLLLLAIPVIHLHAPTLVFVIAMTALLPLLAARLLERRCAA